jgi:hypothetical protein
MPPHKLFRAKLPQMIKAIPHVISVYVCRVTKCIYQAIAGFVNSSNNGKLKRIWLDWYNAGGINPHDSELWVFVPIVFGRYVIRCYARHISSPSEAVQGDECLCVA